MGGVGGTGARRRWVRLWPAGASGEGGRRAMAEAEAQLRAALEALSRKYALATRALAEQSRAVAAQQRQQQQQQQQQQREQPAHLQYKYSRAKRLLKAQSAALVAARRAEANAVRALGEEEECSARWRAEAAEALAGARGAVGSATESANSARAQLLEALGEAEVLRLRLDERDKAIEQRDLHIAHLNAEVLRARSGSEAGTLPPASEPQPHTLAHEAQAQALEPQIGLQTPLDNVTPLALPLTPALSQRTARKTPSFEAFYTPAATLSDAAALRGVECALRAADHDSAELRALKEELECACDALDLKLASASPGAPVTASAMLEMLLERLGNERRELLAKADTADEADVADASASDCDAESVQVECSDGAADAPVTGSPADVPATVFRSAVRFARTPEASSERPSELEDGTSQLCLFRTPGGVSVRSEAETEWGTPAAPIAPIADAKSVGVQAGGGAATLWASASPPPPTPRSAFVTAALSTADAGSQTPRVDTSDAGAQAEEKALSAAAASRPVPATPDMPATTAAEPMSVKVMDRINMFSSSPEGSVVPNKPAARRPLATLRGSNDRREAPHTPAFAPVTPV